MPFGSVAKDNWIFSFAQVPRVGACAEQRSNYYLKEATVRLQGGLSWHPRIVMFPIGDDPKLNFLLS